MMGETMMTMRVGDGPETPPFSVTDLRAAIAKKFKADPEFDAARDKAYDVTAAELRQFIERIEGLAAEKADLAEQQKEVFAEVKGRGYNTKVLRKLIALRRRDQDEVAEEQAIMDLYMTALGMA